MKTLPLVLEGSREFDGKKALFVPTSTLETVLSVKNTFGLIFQSHIIHLEGDGPETTFDRGATSEATTDAAVLLKPYRNDFRCGPNYIAPNGDAAICNGDSPNHCCSPSGWCDQTSAHCDCFGCIDYSQTKR
ncbi:hypothetical protein HOLleu_25102 [Holothuria leucospilota]|uniref:Chitin-binding type-1 domain-containing protein n=1 Tax=Holothuria leucospilota TaxID=206669 RepID=A0A9Q1BS63_HOLLE|nr:hypothetical protein HOLleu_25102 [Holothuria leucospilota]